MTPLIITLIILITIAIVMMVFTLMKRGREVTPKEDIGLKLILEQINELNRTVDEKIGKNARDMQESMQTQLSESIKMIREVTTGLTKLDETNKQVVSFATQLQSLQDILKNPKHRGILGEYYLETLLNNVLAPRSSTLLIISFAVSSICNAFNPCNTVCKYARNDVGETIITLYLFAAL